MIESSMDRPTRLQVARGGFCHRHRDLCSQSERFLIILIALLFVRFARILKPVLRG